MEHKKTIFSSKEKNKQTESEDYKEFIHETR